MCDSLVHRIESKLRIALSEAGAEWIEAESTYSENTCYLAVAIPKAQQDQSPEWLDQTYFTPAIIAVVRTVMEENGGKVAEVQVKAIQRDASLVVVLLASRMKIESYWLAHRRYFQEF